MAQSVNSFELSKYYCQYEKSFTNRRSKKTSTNRAIWILYGWPLGVRNLANANIKSNWVFEKTLWGY